jgi:hypothetical protein
LRAASRALAFTVVAVLAVCAAAGGFALLPRDQDEGTQAPPVLRPLWTEVRWPFPMDPWGSGKAFRCEAANCGTDVTVYFRAKLGFCNCRTGVADDADLDGMGDLDLVGTEVLPVGDGRPVAIGWMKGRSRAYRLAGGRTAISVAFNDRCDMIVATVVVPHDRPETIEPIIIEFLNSGTVLRWAETALGV